MKTRENKVKFSNESAISSSTAHGNVSSFETDNEDLSRSLPDSEAIRNSSEPSIKSRRISSRTKRNPKPVLTALQPLNPDISSTEIDANLQPIDSNNGLLWVGVEGVFDNSSILESRLRDAKDTVNKVKVTRPPRTSRHGHTDIAPNSTNNNSHNHVNNNLLKEEPLFRKFIAEEPCRKRPQDSDEVFFVRMDTSFDGEALRLQDPEICPSKKVNSISNGTANVKFNHRPERREKKAKVKLKEEVKIDDRKVVEMKNLDEDSGNMEGEDKKRKKEDKNRKKKLRHLEEENLSKRIYESRDLLNKDGHSTVPEILNKTQVAQSFSHSEDTCTSDVNSRLEEERKGGTVRLKSCGECGARHAGGICPFSRPTQRLPDKCQFPNMEIHGNHPQNGVIVAPPHTERPINLSNVSQDENLIEETWRDPQRPGSPGCYCRNSLPSGLILEMRPVTTPQENSPDDSDDGAMIGITTTKPLEIETVISRIAISRYTQLGPVVGVAVKEKDIPDDFCMVNLWEVFGAEGKRYMSTVDPAKSNWTRYLRPASDRDSANLIVVPRQLHDSGDGDIIPGLSVESIGGISIFLVSTQNICPGDELMFWAHDPTLAWSRKKMEKTNCGGCNMKFAHPLYYRMHCSVFHDPNYSLTIRKYHCKVCGLAVLGKENIMRHAAEQHEGRGAYQCQFCKKFFLRLNYLDMHRTYGCAANPQRTRPLCDFCGRKFCQPQKLKVHIKRMHSDMEDVLREFQCKLCLKLLGSRAALQRHLKEVHHKVQGQDLSSGATCDRCGKMFQNKSNLKIHMLTHSGVKPFRCLEAACNAAFTTKQCLQFHYKKVHGYSVEAMPNIERCIPYTFDSYSGGLVTDPDTGKITLIPRSPSTEASMETPNGQSDILSSATDTESNSALAMRSRSPSPSLSQELMIDAKLPPAATLRGYVPKYASTTRLVSKGSRKWLGDSYDGNGKDEDLDDECIPRSRDIYTFEDRLDDEGYKKKEMLVAKEEDIKPFRRESNASMLVEAALNVAEHSMKSETHLIGTHDRLLSYAGAVNSATSSSKYSPSIPIANRDDHLLPHEASLSTHIKYTESGDDERSQLEYTLEREYDPRDLPEVVVVHETVNTRDLSESLTHDFHEHLHSALENLPPSEGNIQDIHNVHDLALHKTELTHGASLTPSESNASVSSSGVIEPTLHVLDHLPVTQGLPVNLPSSIAVGLDMTYKHYRIVPEGSMPHGISHDHILSPTPMDEAECGIGLDTMEHSVEINHQELSPRNDNLSDQIPLPELQPHDFRGLHTLRSPSRSPYMSPNHTPEETLRSYLISTDGLRSPHSNDQGIDMSRNNVFIRTSELPTIAYRYQHEVGSSTRGQIYEIDRELPHSIDLSLVGRNVTYAEISRTVNAELYENESRMAPSTPTVYITSDRDDVRQSLDLTIPRSVESESPHDSSIPIDRSSSPHTLQPNISHTDVLSSASQLIAYSQISPSTHTNLSPMHTSIMERNEVSSPNMDTTQDSLDSSSPGPSTSLPIIAPLPPISRIVSASPHTFYTARQIIPASRQDITLSLPTHVYTESYVVSNGMLIDQQPPTPGPTPPCSGTDKDRPSSPSYLQYPSSPYDRYHQEPSSPPSGFHYQYY